MDGKKLRARYDALTPFERAALAISESVHARREEEKEALRPRDARDASWTAHWGEAMIHTAWYALFYACMAHLAASLAQTDEMRDAAASASVGWTAALLRMQEETGAPLADAARILSADYADVAVHAAEAVAAAGGEAPEDWAGPYDALRRIWDSYAAGGKR